MFINRNNILTAFSILLTVFITIPAIAQKAIPDTNTILIGDQVGIKLSIPIDKGEQILFPQFDEKIIEGIVLIEISEPDTSKQNELEQIYTVTSFEDSTFTIPPFIFIVDGDSLKTDSFILNVKYFIPDSAFITQIDTSQAIPLTDIKQVIKTPMTFAEFKERFGDFILIVFAVIFILGIGIYLYIRRKKNKPIFAASKPKIPPYEKAVKALRELEEEGFPQGKRIKVFYDNLTQILRVYIEERFKIPATDFISLQIITALRTNSETDNKYITELESMLRTSDLVKFAKHVPDEYINERNLKTGFEFLEATKPVKETDNLTEENKINTERTKNT